MYLLLNKTILQELKFRPTSGNRVKISSSESFSSMISSVVIRKYVYYYYISDI